MAEPLPIILILGPTAGGKTGLAIELATRLPGGGECISADSMQIYRGMNIGTAKPTAEERAAAQHHLIDIADPAETDFSVDRWLDLAERTIADIRRRGRWPIVVGGTNLYVKALLEGLFDGPPADPELRAELDEMSEEELRQQLERVDPDAAARIHPNDRRRTIRAIEVFRRTGSPISAQQQEWDGKIRDDVLIIGLDYLPEVINRRINARVRRMIDDGLVEEARSLWSAGTLGPQAVEALGYKQLISHFEGDCSLHEAIEEIKIRTRRYAKQQRTWLRRFRILPRALWLSIEEENADLPIEMIVRWIENESESDRVV